MEKRTFNWKGIILGLAAVLYFGSPAMAQNFGNLPKGHVKPQEATDAAVQPGHVEPQDTTDAAVQPAASAEVTAEPSSEEILQQVKAISDEKEYTLGRDDEIVITVMRHPEVSGQFFVNSRGEIQYEFVGDIKVEGMTKEQVKEKLSEHLSKYIINPDISVKIVGYNSKVVFVVGEVGRPGKIFMRGDTITVREALLEAQLPLLSASLKKCRLVTPANNGKAGTQYVNIESLLYEGDLRENLVMKPGDTLYIPATVMAKVMRTIQPVTQPVTESVSTGRTVYPAF